MGVVSRLLTVGDNCALTVFAVCLSRRSYRWKASEVWRKVNRWSLKLSRQTKVLKRHSSAVLAVRTARAANDGRLEKEKLERLGQYCPHSTVVQGVTWSNKNLAIANRSRVSCINTNYTMTLKPGLEVTQGH